MKNYYNVSFKYSETVYCANIAHAESEDAVENYYSEYEWIHISKSSPSDVELAKRKGMPIIEIDS